MSARLFLQSEPGARSDFMTLPARYRNTFIGFFGQNRSPLTFALLQQCLQQADATPHSAPEWVTIYQRLQKALLGYNARLSAVHIETEHHRVELAARGAAIEHLRDSTLQDQERTQAFEQGLPLPRKGTSASRRRARSWRRGRKDLKLRLSSPTVTKKRLPRSMQNWNQTRLRSRRELRHLARSWKSVSVRVSWPSCWLPTWDG